MRSSYFLSPPPSIALLHSSGNCFKRGDWPASQHSTKHCQIKVKSFQLCVLIMSYANFCLGIILQKVDLNRRGYGLLSSSSFCCPTFFRKRTFPWRFCIVKQKRTIHNELLGPKKKGKGIKSFISFLT